MVILLSPLKNDLLKNIIVIILCAGEGTRLKKFTKEIPKPLIKVKSLNNKPILHHTINLLFKLGIQQIALVKGHLGHEIDEFLDSFIQDNPSLKTKLTVIDSENKYKLGPLHSFLSITKDRSIFKEGSIYLLIPGDTIFEFELINKLLSSLSEHSAQLKQNPIIFYRKIKTTRFLKKTNKKIISIAELINKDGGEYLKCIKTVNLSEVYHLEFIRLMIPLISFSHDFVDYILKLDKLLKFNTVKKVLNHVASKGLKILAIKIEKSGMFHDIDNELDLLELNKKKRDK